jgi:hypothetical protein
VAKFGELIAVGFREKFHARIRNEISKLVELETYVDLLINSATQAKVSRHAMTHNSPKDGMFQNPFPFESIYLNKLNY